MDFNNTQIAFSSKNDKALRRSYQIFRSMQHPTLYKIGLAMPSSLVGFFPVKEVIHRTIFNQFVAGRTLEEAWQAIRALKKDGLDSALDYGVEYQDSEEDMDSAMRQIIKSIEFRSEEASSGLQHITIKLTALFSEHTLTEMSKRIGENVFDFPENENQPDWKKGVARVEKICQAAANRRLGVLIDAEESWLQPVIDAVTNKMMRRYNRETALVYNTFQLYRKDKFVFLKKSKSYADEHHFILGAKLVRGAYIEKENEYAKKAGQPSVIFENKELVDESYNSGLLFCLENYEKVSTMIASHNEKSIALALDYMQRQGISARHPHICFSQLYGMGDSLSYNLAHGGFNVVKYLPYGDVKSVFSYLLRRAKENSAMKGQSARELSLLKIEMKRRNLL